MHRTPSLPLSNRRPPAPQASTARKRVAAAALVALLFGTAAHAELTDLSLEELMQVEVTSASGKAERIAEVAAAVHVLTREDLRRSGATTIPDALRLVPGIDVGRIDATKWAVSARGFNGRFANKLLVLLDGRQVYSPIFSGVLWDEQHVPFDLIERIEIVRGPGATIWGANAVNGVINIITRPAAAASGSEVELGGGNRDSRSIYARHAGSLGDTADYRVWLQALTSDPTELQDARDDDDTWQDLQAGSRIDWHTDNDTDFALHWQVRKGDSNELLRLGALNPLRVRTTRSNIDSRSGFLTADWTRRQDDGGQLKIHAHLDRSDRRTAFYEWELTNAELGISQRLLPLPGHDVVWGASYRFSDVPYGGGANSTLQSGPNDTAKSIEFFVQDEIALSEHVSLIVGARLERSEITGWEPQPNLRLAWDSDVGTLWAAVSRAVRTPSPGESDIAFLLAPVVLPPGQLGNPFPLPLGNALSGNGDLDSERLLAYELGWRGQFVDAISASISLYRHEYDDLVNSQALGLACAPSGQSVQANPACLFASTHLIAHINVANAGRATTQGVEADLRWHINERWQLAASVDVRDHDSGDRANANFAAGYGAGDPQLIASARMNWQPTSATEVNLVLRHVGDADKYAIDDYTTLDARLSWRLNPGLSLEFLGNNLLEQHHREYASELNDIDAADVERSALIRLTWTR